MIATDSINVSVWMRCADCVYLNKQDGSCKVAEKRRNEHARNPGQVYGGVSAMEVQAGTRQVSALRVWGATG